VGNDGSVTQFAGGPGGILAVDKSSVRARQALTLIEWVIFSEADNKMNLNYKHLGMYLVAGIASGLICTFPPGIIDNDLLFFGTNFTPAIILGIMIFLAGRYISGITSRNTWLNPLILILACGVGWYLAGEHYASEFYIGEVESGVIGGFFVGIGLVIAWRLKRTRMVIMLTTLAGGLGGLVLALVGFQLLFIYWQGILLLGMGIAIQIDSHKSSIS
jgi:hypothetical protein